MKTLFALGAAAALLSAGSARGDILSTQSVSTKLSVDGAGVKNERLGSTFSSSGENITVTIGSVGGGTAGTAAAVTADSAVSVTVPGGAYLYSTSVFSGSSAASMTPTVTAGVLSALGAADVQTTTNGGVTGTLAATNLSTGAATITAGGAGTQAEITRINQLSAF